jgi:Domain of unknown function (DUF5668)
MTDDTPSPTTRIPVPDPAAESPTEGWPGATAPEAEPTADVESWAGPPGDPPPAPNEPVLPVAPMATKPRRDGRDHGRTASILFGLVVLAVGLWFFVERTLGYDLPDVRWSQLWPAALIGIGLWVVLGSMRRGSR